MKLLYTTSQTSTENKNFKTHANANKKELEDNKCKKYKYQNNNVVAVLALEEVEEVYATAVIKVALKVSKVTLKKMKRDQRARRKLSIDLSEQRVTQLSLL